MVHPIYEPQFEQMNSLNPPFLHSFKAPVVWNGDVYALGRDHHLFDFYGGHSDHSNNGKLFKYSLSSNKWNQISIDSSIYVSGCVLTTYQSKLLLISGGDTMTVWEFHNNNFEQSCIKPVPSTFPKLKKDNIFTTSTDKDLIIASWGHFPYLDFVQLIYDGRDWRFRKCYDREGRQCHEREQSYSTGALEPPEKSTTFLTNGHAIFDVTGIPGYCLVTSVQKLSIHTIDSFDEGDKIVDADYSLNWEKYDVIMRPERRSCFVTLHNQQFYFIDAQGEIFTSFIQSPIVPVIWGNCGVEFLRAPYLVGLPDGSMLMIGMIGKRDPQREPGAGFEVIGPRGVPGAELDVIKVSQKGIMLASEVLRVLDCMQLFSVHVQLRPLPLWFF